MPRAVKDAKLDSRTARGRLAPSAKPYYRALDHGLHIGYRKGARAGRWVARFYLGGQQYEVETIGTADDSTEADGVAVLDWRQAQDAARKRAAERAKSAAGIGGKPLTVEDACKDYISDLRARKGESAAKGADGRLHKHLLPEFGSKLLAELTTAELNGWRNGMVKEEGDEEEIRRSRDTANRMLTIAKAAFNLAFNNDHVTDDRAWRKVKPFKNVGMPRQIILTVAQQQNLMDACPPDLREFALLTARTGARPGRELTEARVRDLEPGQATLRVCGKTGRREVHLDPDALRQLRRLASGKRPDDFLLTTAEGRPWTKSLHQRPVAAAVEKAGLDPETTLYALRHTYISGSLKQGNPADAVARHCGTSLAMIQRYYAKWISSDLAEYAQKAAPKLRDTPAGKVARLGVVG